MMTTCHIINICSAPSVWILASRDRGMSQPGGLLVLSRSIFNRDEEMAHLLVPRDQGRPVPLEPRLLMDRLPRVFADRHNTIVACVRTAPAKSSLCFSALRLMKYILELPGYHTGLALLVYASCVHHASSPQDAANSLIILQYIHGESTATVAALHAKVAGLVDAVVRNVAYIAAAPLVYPDKGKVLCGGALSSNPLALEKTGGVIHRNKWLLAQCPKDRDVGSVLRSMKIVSYSPYLIVISRAPIHPEVVGNCNSSGSPADKADLEVGDEILEVNGRSLEDASHTEVISHIHQV
ncbi:hypothetical protein B566_EDAN014404 [Ephemera danica]|nr:hypothetical protein B566_EDAN014404 [Ephemera danica]